MRMNILGVPQRQPTAGTYRHLESLMAELGWLLCVCATSRTAITMSRFAGTSAVLLSSAAPKGKLSGARKRSNREIILNQHTHAKHPRFSPPSASISPPAASDVLDDHDMDGDHFMENIEPSHSIRSKFVGPNNALFRNYHPGLTG